MQQLKTNAWIDLKEEIQHLTVIVYDQYSLPEVEEFVQQQILFEDKLLLYRNKHYVQSQKQSNQNKSKFQETANVEHHQYYLIMQVNQQNDLKQYQDIQRVIGFANLIFAVQVDRDKQQFIQRKYLEMGITIIDQESKKYQNFDQASQQSRRSLHFINSNYKKSHARKGEYIYYWKKLGNVNQFLQTIGVIILKGKQLEKNNKDNKVKKQSKLLSAKQQQAAKQLNKHNSCAFTVLQLINIFNQCQLLDKPTFQVKSVLKNYKRLHWQKNKLLQAQKNLFETVFDEVNPRIAQKKIVEFGIAKTDEQKLIWKYKQLRRYKQLIEQKQVNKLLVSKYKNSPLFQLSQSVINMQLQSFHQRWLSETFKQLKLSFNLIANRRDTKAIEHFRNQCEKASSKIQSCLNSKNLQKQNKILLENMNKKINDFIKYHEDVIRNQNNFFNGIRFYRKQSKYLWENQRKIYEKLGLLLSIITLAMLQENVILGVTILVFGIIFSAVNI